MLGWADLELESTDYDLEHDLYIGLCIYPFLHSNAIQMLLKFKSTQVVDFLRCLI